MRAGADAVSFTICRTVHGDGYEATGMGERRYDWYETVVAKVERAGGSGPQSLASR